MNELENKLRSQGWVQDQAGGWSHPSRRAVGKLQDPKPEHREVQALAGGAPAQAGGTNGLVYRISIISFRRRLLDRDNLIGGAKSLRDAIALSTGLPDDSDRYIEWSYEQIISKTEGTIVLLEKL